MILPFQARLSKLNRASLMVIQLLFQNKTQVRQERH
jgi:hypothetical protein